MSDFHEIPQPPQPQPTLESLPDAAVVRDEVRRTSRRFKLLLELLGLCEKAEADRPRSPSSSAQG